MSKNEPVRNFSAWEIFQVLLFVGALIGVYGGIVLWIGKGIWYVLPLGIGSFGGFMYTVWKQPKPKQ